LASTGAISNGANVWLQPKEEDIMRKFLGVGAAAALALMAHVAAADSVKGPISNINLTANTFMVGDKSFSAAPANTVGTKLSDLKEGDMVTVNYAHVGDTSGKSTINALTLMNEE
jgi:hypothetical protein